MEIQNKLVVITGVSKGIGLCLTQEFLKRGAHVVGLGRSKPDLNNNSFTFIQTNVRSHEEVDRAFETINQTFNQPVDVLVNNAGGVAHPAKFEELDTESRRWEIALNVDGVVNCCQAVAGDMLGRSTGSIINISSNSSLLGEAAAEVAHYGGVKGFVNSFSKALAWEWAKRGVRVNNICPGWIVPENAEDVGAGSFWNRFGTMGQPADMQKALEDGSLYNMSGLPIPRLGRPEDIANLALFLASDVSGYITGQLISVSGGAYMP